jgi:hypothetical protein
MPTNPEPLIYNVSGQFACLILDVFSRTDEIRNVVFSNEMSAFAGRAFSLLLFIGEGE